METDLVKRLDEARKAIVDQAGSRRPPEVGVVLGSGLGMFADRIVGAAAIPYEAIPHMPVPTVVGHHGRLCLGEVAGVQVACLQGRAHAYEGHPFERVVFGARLLGRLGCKAVVITNAAGGIGAGLQPGTLMLVTDHLNLMANSPLIGPNPDELGTRFPDMSRPYDPHFGALAREAAAAVGITLAEGVYAALLGPSYETPAEIRMLRTLGADAVGMSTVPEVIALRHMGVRVAAMSCITNLAAGLSSAALSHEEVAETARRVGDQFVAVLGAWVERIGLATRG
jgi:purine-nucleoside phosphorylase